MSANVRHIKKGEQNIPAPCAESAILSPEVIEALRLIVREELKKDRMYRRRALLAEVDSINRELEVK